MNRKQANDLRATMGLLMIEEDPQERVLELARKRRAAANKAARAEANREMKSKRQKR